MLNLIVAAVLILFLVMTLCMIMYDNCDIKVYEQEKLEERLRWTVPPKYANKSKNSTKR